VVQHGVPHRPVTALEDIPLYARSNLQYGELAGEAHSWTRKWRSTGHVIGRRKGAPFSVRGNVKKQI